MDKKNKKFYDKAIKHYQSGEINKALGICEEGLSYSLKNSSLLNLKGILLYQQGNLDEAITVWKINKDFNDDSMAKNYINDAKEDQNRKNMYLLGEQKLKGLNIDEAIALFERCKESDFNCIKVNTALALCYQKKGQFVKCIEYMNKVLSVDKKSKVANQIKKELIEVKAYKDSSKKLAFLLMSLIVAVLIIIVTYNYPKYLLKSNEEVNNNLITSQENKDIENSIESDNNKENIKEVDLQEENKDIKNNTLNMEKLKQALANEDVDNIYLELLNINKNDIKDEDKDIYMQGINILKDIGVEQFYENAMKEFNLNNFEKASLEFERAYNYSDDSYLREHIVFYRAVTLDKLENNEEAIKLYDEYCNEYADGSYTDNALYNVSLLTNENDKEKSLYYANKLKDKFPNSIYFNENIIKILNN